MLHSQARDGLIFRIKTWPRNGANCRLINFSKRCCLNATRRRQAIVLRRKRVGKFWTHATHAAGSGRARQWLSAHPPFVCMWKDKSGITSLRLCFPQEQLKRSHCATRLCPCGFRFRRVVAMHEASPSRPFEPFRRARPGAFAAMQPTAPIRHGRSPARSSASASLCSAARACIGDCKTRFP